MCIYSTIFAFSVVAATEWCNASTTNITCACDAKEDRIISRCSLKSDGTEYASVEAKMSNLPQIRAARCDYGALPFIHFKSLVVNSSCAVSALFNGRQLQNFVQLVVSPNNAQVIGQDWLGLMTSLTFLDLIFDNVLPLPEKLFQPLTNLKRLSLAIGYHSSLPDQSLNSLEYLNVSVSHNSSFPEKLFHPLKDLKRLSLAIAPNSSFPEKLFQPLISLTHLSLAIGYHSSLPEELFQSLNSLKRLSLAIGYHSSFPEKLFRRLKNLERLVLAIAPNLSFPEKLFQPLISLTHLILANAPNSSFPEDLFYTLKNLKRLSLAIGCHSSFPEHLFQSLYRLEYLNVSVSHNSSLPEKLFQPLTYLKCLVLEIAHNSSFPEKLFHRLKNLKRLSLKIGPNSSFPEKLFQRLTNLKHLVLEIAPNSSFPEKLFQPLISLKRLSLKIGYHSSLPEELFQSLNSLEYLNVSVSHNSSLPEKLFQPLTNLKRLVLKISPNSSLPEKIFQRLTRLRSLSLRDSALTSLPEHTFKHLDKLETLDISHNKLEGLSNSTFRCSASLTRLVAKNAFNGIREVPCNATSEDDVYSCAQSAAIGCPTRCLTETKMMDPTLFHTLLTSSHIFHGVGIQGREDCITISTFDEIQVAELLPCDPRNKAQHLGFVRPVCSDTRLNDGWFIRAGSFYLRRRLQEVPSHLSFEVVSNSSLLCHPEYIFKMDSRGWYAFYALDKRYQSQWWFKTTVSWYRHLLTIGFPGERSRPLKFFGVATKLSEQNVRIRETHEASSNSQEFWTKERKENATFLLSDSVSPEAQCAEGSQSLLRCQPSCAKKVGILYFVCDGIDHKCGASVVRGGYQEFGMYEANIRMILTSGSCVASDAFHTQLLFVPGYGVWDPISSWAVSHAYTYDYGAATVGFLFVDEAISDVTEYYELTFAMGDGPKTIPAMGPYLTTCETQPSVLSSELALRIPSFTSQWFPLGLPWMAENSVFGVTTKSEQKADFITLYTAPFDDSVKYAYHQILSGEQYFCVDT